MSHQRPFFFFISLRAFPFLHFPPLLLFFGEFPACTQRCQALQPLDALQELSAAGETEEMATLKGFGFLGSRVLPAPSGYLREPVNAPSHRIYNLNSLVLLPPGRVCLRAPLHRWGCSEQSSAHVWLCPCSRQPAMLWGTLSSHKTCN